MALQDAIRNATRPVMAKLMAELGSRVNVRRFTTTRAPDNSSVKTWGGTTNGTNVPCKLEIITIAHVQRVWGMSSDVVVEGTIPAASNVDIKGGDGIIVTEGFLAGKSYTVEQVKPDDLGQYTLLGLVEPRGVIQ